MDFTPQSQNISEDSGCITRTSEISSTVYDEKSSITPYIETPTTTSTSNCTRKRKLSLQNDNFSYKRSLEMPFESSYESPAIFDTRSGAPSNFLSSTLNESLSKSLEKCNLGNYTPNFYVERSPSELDGERSLKKFKLDDGSQYQPKTRSAPSTPTKHLEVNESYIRGKSQSEHLNSCHTPTKNSSYKCKLGSPERLELLYPNIKSITSPPKLKTPEKLREFIKKVNSPAKKRLFKNLQPEGTFKRIDPISVFVIKNDLRHIVSKIFEYLSNVDLCTVSRVSKSWRKALSSDYKAFPRYYSYAQEFNSNKENILKDALCYKSYSPPSPVRDSFHKYTKIASQLLPSQSLQKCLQCTGPAVIQRSISQCQNPNCEYIYCMNCLSFSTTGPEHFIDKCHTSELVVSNKQTPSSRSGLYDISNGGNDLQSKCDSSGYISESDISPVIRQNLNSTVNVKNHSALMNISNRTENSALQRRSRRSSLLSVVSPCSTPKIVDIMEPSSPPKIKIVACSKQSKRNLKRLNF